MKRGIRVLPQADADVDALADYIAQDSLDQAIRFLDAVEATYESLSETAEVWAVYPLANVELRGVRKLAVSGFRNHLVFYRIDADMVEIIRVLHGSRDVPAALDE